jgi:hypothetical protein
MARRSVWRRLERWMVGLAMGVVAFVLEKAVMRSVRKGARRPRLEPDAQTFRSRGKDVHLDPEKG